MCFGFCGTCDLPLVEMFLRQSNVRAAIDNGTVAHSLTLTFPEPTIAEWAGYAGFDVLHLDMEHGGFDWESAEMMCRVFYLVRIFSCIQLM